MCEFHKHLTYILPPQVTDNSWKRRKLLGKSFCLTMMKRWVFCPTFGVSFPLTINPICLYFNPYQMPKEQQRHLKKLMITVYESPLQTFNWITIWLDYFIAITLLTFSGALDFILQVFFPFPSWLAEALSEVFFRLNCWPGETQSGESIVVCMI